MTITGDTNPGPFAVTWDERYEASSPDMVSTPTDHNERSSPAPIHDANGEPLIERRCVCAFFFLIGICMITLWVRFSGSTTPYSSSFVFFCFSVMEFYAMEQPWLNCVCHDWSQNVVCRGTHSGYDMDTGDDAFDNVATTTTTATTNTSKTTGSSQLSVVIALVYDVSDGSYSANHCECETDNCDPTTTRCYGVSSFNPQACFIRDQIYGYPICYSRDDGVVNHHDINNNTITDLCVVCPSNHRYISISASQCQSTKDLGSNSKGCIETFIPQTFYHADTMEASGRSP
jgi:hypothetical protein